MTHGNADALAFAAAAKAGRSAYSSASGDIVTFRGDGSPLRDLKVSLDPVQAGTGDPSPENVRPISGRTGTNVYQSAAFPDPSAWDVLGYDEDVFVDHPEDACMTIQAKQVLRQLTFDPPQFLFAVTAAACTAFGWPNTGMPAGKYKVTLNHGAYGNGTAQDGTYVFTTSRIVPVGGGIRHSTMGVYQSSYTKDQITGGKFTTYGADKITIEETGLVCTEYDAESDIDAVDLGTTVGSSPSYKSGDYINFTERQAYGSDRWSTSWIRQYLNSDEETFVWVPKTIWSRKNSGSYEGFLHTIDPELREVLGKVRTRYALNVSDGSGYEDVEDFCKLMTYTDITGSKNNNVAEGPVDGDGNVTRTGRYSFWKSRTTSADRIKYQGTTARRWWLASALTSRSGNVWHVNTSGTISENNANSSHGIVPSLFIRLARHIHVTLPSEIGTIYGGALDVTTGVLTVDGANIANYNGEPLPGKWISDRDVYAPGTTPTIGAQVVYTLATTITIPLTPTEISTLQGQNNVWADTGPVDVEYKDTVKAAKAKLPLVLRGRGIDVSWMLGGST